MYKVALKEPKIMTRGGAIVQNAEFTKYHFLSYFQNWYPKCAYSFLYKRSGSVSFVWH